MRASKALQAVIERRPSHILDVGCGKGAPHAAAFREAGLKVTTLDAVHMADIRYTFGGYAYQKDCGQWPLNDHDCIWMSHVLEHCENTCKTISSAAHMAGEDGLLAITVPQMKKALVGGHLHLFTAGTLVYQMIRSGLDCSKAMVCSSAREISVLVHVKWHGYSYGPPYHLLRDNGEIQQLAKYFPWPVTHGMTDFPDTGEWA